MKPFVSVIVPNYNYGSFLKDCLESIINQTYENFEVIVVDDGSTDHSLEIAHTFPQVRLLTQANKGVNSARNLGIQFAKGELIALCDSDDLWLPNKLSSQIELLMRKPDVVVVYSSILQFSTDLKHTTLVQAQHRGNLHGLYDKYPGRALIINGPSTALFSKEKALSVGLFDESLRGNAEDWEFFRRICAKGETDFVPVPLTRVRLHNESRSTVDLRTLYQGNKQAIELAMSKDVSFSTYKRILMRSRLEKQFIKSYLKQASILGSLWHIKNLLKSYLN